jgi:hypothetical protein
MRQYESKCPCEVGYRAHLNKLDVSTGRQSILHRCSTMKDRKRNDINMSMQGCKEIEDLYLRRGHS